MAVSLLGWALTGWARERSPYDVLTFDNRAEIQAMHAVAAARRWVAVSDTELERARATGGSLRAALGETIIMVVEDRVYRVPSSEALPLPRGVTGSPGSTGALPETFVLDGASRGFFNANTETMTPYVLVGGDNRIPVPPILKLIPPSSKAILPGATFNVFQAPYRQLARIVLSRLAPLGNAGCSGAFFGPRHVLTSGHCFGLAVTQVTVTASASGTAGRGPSTAVAWFILGTGDTDDLALIVLPDTQAVTSTGFYGWQLSSAANEGSPIWIAGYPGAFQFCLTNPSGPNFPFCGDAAGNRILYESTCSLTEVDEELEYPCDTSSGMSGAPVVRYINNTPRIIGVHKGQDDDVLDWENRAVRLTHLNVLWLCSLVSQTPSASVPFTCGS